MVRLLLTMSVFALGAMLLARPSARAACDPQLISQAVVARIDQESIDAVLQPVGSLIPEQLDLSDFNASIDCGSFFQATTITTHRGQIRLSLDTLRVRLQNNLIVLDISGDIEATANFDISVCSLPTANCDAGLNAAGVAIHAEVALGVDACVPSVTVNTFTIDLDDDDVAISLTSCGAYGFAYNLVDEWIRDDLLDYAKQEIADYIPQLLDDQVSALTTDLLSETLTFEGLSFRAQPESLSVDSSGLTLGFAAAASPDSIADCAKGIAVDNRAGTSTAVSLPTSTSVAVSHRLAQNLVTSAWQAGWMCLDLSDVEPTVTDVLSTILPGAKTAITVNVTEPPQLTFTSSSVGAATIVLPAISGTVEIDVPNDGDYTADYATGFSVGADVSIRQETNQIVLSPRDAAVDPVAVNLGATSIGFTEDSINRFVRGSIAPLFTTTLRELPMVSALFDASLVAIVVEDLHTTSSAIIAEVGLAGIVGNDITPPSTVIVGQIPATCGPTLVLTAKSTDDTTDATMVRHWVEVDGTRQRAIAAGGTVSIGPMSAGTHRVRIAAVDLNGNIDPDGTRFDVLVDATPPVITLPDAPIGIIPANGTKLEVEIDDDIAKASSYDYEVAVVSRIAEPDEVFIRATLDVGEPIVLMNLPDAVTVRVTVIAHDVAGNASSVSKSFAVLDQPTMGCSSVSADWLVCLVALIALKRRGL